jgi:excisionase family DNA binding protein
MQGKGTGSADRLLSVNEAAHRLRTSTATVYALCERRTLPHVRLSTHAIRIGEQDLAEFIRLRRRDQRS